ncbi:hypothetical protein WA158_006235 [Blastocystis sp. Blastoise]
MSRTNIRNKTTKTKVNVDKVKKEDEILHKKGHKKRMANAKQLISRKLLEDKLKKQQEEDKLKQKKMETKNFDMDDLESLLNALPSSESKKQEVNQIPKSFKGKNKLAYLEVQRLKNVLANESLQNNPFETVQNHLAFVNNQNVKSKDIDM